MELRKTNERRRCDMGGCKRNAAYTVRLNRSGIRSTLYLCEACMKELYRIIGREIVPKSFETLGKREKGEGYVR